MDHIGDGADTEPKHPIKVVVRRTGLSADVIRAWERRYGAVSPQRSSTDRRLYSDVDVERLRLLRRATVGGRRIGDVAGLSRDALVELVDEDASAVEQVGLTASTQNGSRDSESELQACLRAVMRMDSVALDAALGEAAVSLGTPALLRQVIEPLLAQLGELWRAGKLRVAHEHLASAHVRSFLGGIVATANPSGSGPILLVTTPAGQVHELGALTVAATAATLGWLPVYLGCNMPAEEIAYAVRANAARAIALSITYPNDDPNLADELRRLRRHLSNDTAIVVGGRACGGYQKVLREIGALPGSDLESLCSALEGLRESNT